MAVIQTPESINLPKKRFKADQMLAQVPTHSFFEQQPLQDSSLLASSISALSNRINLVPNLSPQMQK